MMRDTDDYWEANEEDNDNKCFQQQVVFIHDPYVNNQANKPKTRRRRWTQKDMTNAFNAVKCTGMSLRGAASHYNVPESTLRDRVHGRVSLDCSRPGPPTFFTFEEEKKMVDHILFMSKIGYPYTRNQVVELAGDMTKAVDRIAPFKFLNPSQAWFYAFLNRWPDLKNYLYGPRSNRKSKGVSAESIQAYYENLDKVLIKYDIKNKPDHIWMTDEVSIACDNSNVPKILPITIQRPQSNTYWNPTAAVLGAGNAAGDKIPAFLMFKASEISEEMMEGSVKGSKFATSSNGWVNADAFIQWYERHFRPLIPQRPVILLYDGHLQFVTVRVLEKAKEDNVLLFPLPPHPPYNHCVESSCFAAYPKYFTKRIQKYHDDFKRNVNKTNVSRIICQAYEWALQPINLIQTFFKLGICPYNNLSNSLAPYMPNSNDDDPNDDNMDSMDLTESEFMQNNSVCGGMSMFSGRDLLSNMPLAHSPIMDRSYNQNENFPVMQNNVSQSKLNQNDFFTPHSLNTSGMYSSIGNIKVLDNMASKAMNQMHTQRAELIHSKVRPALPICTSVPEINNQSKILSIKNSGTSKNSIVLRANQSQLTAICKISPTNSLPIYSVGSGTNQIKVVPPDPISSEQNIFISQTISSNTSNNTPIKVFKSSNNVIIKPTSSTAVNNRPIIRLQPMSTSGQKKTSIIISKSESFIKVGVEYKNSSPSVPLNSSNITHPMKTVNTSITTPVVYENQHEMEVTELVELKTEIDCQNNGEINQNCHVCGRIEPPGLLQISEAEELVVDWAHCDFCHKWVHLHPCCDSSCVQPDNRFKCVVCIKQHSDQEMEKILNKDMCIAEDETFYLLNESENPLPLEESAQLLSYDQQKTLSDNTVYNTL